MFSHKDENSVHLNFHPNFLIPHQGLEIGFLFHL
jgi:hypothetical protein